MRSLLAGPLDQAASWLSRLGVTPGAATAAGLLVGVAAAVAAGIGQWTTALVLWLVSRLADGLDGPMARVTGQASPWGGYLDIVADFTVYGAFVVGCAIGQPDARVAMLVLLLTYYVNGTAFLAFSSAVGQIGTQTGLEDERTHVFSRGLAEGTETIVAHSLFVGLPGAMVPLAWVFAAMVTITIAQRLVVAVRLLRDHRPSRGTSR